MKNLCLIIAKKEYLTIAILLFLLLLLPLLLILVKKRQEIRPKAAFGTVNLALTPDSLAEPKNVGDTFDVEVQIIQPETPTATPTPTPGDETPTATPTITPTPPPSDYWVSFSPKGEPANDWDIADRLLNLLSSNGLQPTEINRWVNSGWNAHLKDLPSNKFSIKSGEGYVIKFTQPPNVSLHEGLTYEDTASKTYDLQIGYNLIGIPESLIQALGGGDSPTGEDLCQSIQGQGGEVVGISVHADPAGVSDEYWNSYTCGDNANSASINAGDAYFVRLTQPATWNLPGAPTATPTPTQSDEPPILSCPSGEIVQTYAENRFDSDEDLTPVAENNRGHAYKYNLLEPDDFAKSLDNWELSYKLIPRSVNSGIWGMNVSLHTCLDSCESSTTGEGVSHWSSLINDTSHLSDNPSGYLAGVVNSLFDTSQCPFTGSDGSVEYCDKDDLNYYSYMHQVQLNQVYHVKITKMNDKMGLRVFDEQENLLYTDSLPASAIPINLVDIAGWGNLSTGVGLIYDVKVNDDKRLDFYVNRPDTNKDMRFELDDLQVQGCAAPGGGAVRGTEDSVFSISAVDITLAFDKNILEVASVSLPDSPAFTDLLIKEILNDEGKVHFSVIAQKPTDELPSGPVIPVVKVTFKAKGPGTSAVTFEQHNIVGYNEQNEDVALGVDQKTEGSYTIVGEGGTPTPTITPGGPTLTPNPTGMPDPTIPRVNFGIKFRGMGNQRPDLKVRLRVIDEKEIEEPKKDFEDIEIIADENKIYRPKNPVVLEGITAGANFTLLVKGPKHLQKRMAKRIEIFEGEDERNKFDWYTDEKNHLDPGDLPPQDGVCNTHDWSRLLNRLDSSKEEDLAIADLNYDGIVNMNDYSLLLGTLREKYEDEE